jgi:hypothetical protein
MNEHNMSENTFSKRSQTQKGGHILCALETEKKDPNLSERQF